MKSLLATMNQSALTRYEPLAALGALMPNIPKDHLLVLIAFTFSGLQNEAKQRNEQLTKEVLSSAIQQTLKDYELGTYTIEKKGNDYSLYEV
jgi:hypothetical protein